MTYAKNSLGRSTGRRFNMAAIKREMAKKPEVQSENYRGFEISGTVGKHFFVGNWQSIYKTLDAAREAVDVCLQLRAALEAA